MTPEQKARLEELLACWTPWSDSHDAIDAAITDADRLAKLEVAARALVDHLLDFQTYPADYDGQLRLLTAKLSQILGERALLDEKARGT